MKPMKVIIVLAVLLTAACCFADTITLNSGDVLTGTVLTEYFGLDTSYQNLFFKNDFVASIATDPAKADQYTVKTINNDLFSGKLINTQIEAKLNTGEKAILAVKTLKGISLASAGETHELDTTVFSMNNGDRFSGRLLSQQLNITTDQLSVTVKQADMKRIVFKKPCSKEADIYLKDGTLLVGELTEDMLSIAPDSLPMINVCAAQFKTIQFNATKYVKKTITLEEYTDKLTGTPAFAGLFPNVSTDITGNGEKCRKAEAKTAPVEQAEPAAGAEELKISNILFDTDRYDIKPEYFALIKKIAAVLENDPSMKVQINGHADIVGTAGYNQVLSMNRARAVAQALMDAGIAKARISINGYGFTLPVSDNATEKGRSLNRRVEVLLVK